MYDITIGVDKPDMERLRRAEEAMAARGIQIKDISELRRIFNDVRDQLKRQIEEKYDIDNINSHAQVTDYLRRVSDEVPYGDRNDYINTCYENGKWTTDKYAMNKLSLLGYEFADDLLQYRQAKSDAEKVNSIAENMDRNNMIHPVVTMAKTHRISYSAPALGQIRKNLLRYMLEPVRDGDVLYSADIKNQEPGILINALGDEELLSALRSGDGLYENMFKFVFRPFTTMTLLEDTLPEDRIYSQNELKNNILVPCEAYTPMEAPCKAWRYNGERVIRVQRICQGITDIDGVEYPDTVMIECAGEKLYNVPVQWEKAERAGVLTGWLVGVDIDMSRQERKEFKTSFLAITYGASQMGIEKQCKIIDAKLLYKRITSLKGMASYRKQCSKAASKGVRTLSTVFGTPVTTDKDGSTNELKRSLLSIPIQGTGADILDLLIDHVDKEAVKVFQPGEVFVYFTRHDELILEVSKEMLSRYGVDKFEKWLHDTVTHRINGSVPFEVEVTPISSITLSELLQDEE